MEVIREPAEVEGLSITDGAVHQLVAPNRAKRAWIGSDRPFYLIWSADEPADASGGLLVANQASPHSVEIPAGVGLWCARLSNVTNIRAGLYSLSSVPASPAVGLAAVGHDSIEASWAEYKPPGESRWRPPATSWRSRIRTAPAEGSPGNWGSSRSSGDDDRTFSGLAASTRYEIGVTATNARGAGKETVIAATTGPAP